MRYIPVLIIPIIASVFGGCNPKPEDTDVSGPPAEVERTIEVGPRLDRGKKRNKKGSPRTISVHASSSTKYTSQFDALIAQKRADMSHAPPGPNLDVQIDSCTESVSNTSSYRATGAKRSLSDGYEDPWNIVVMSPVAGSTDREDRAFQYFLNDAAEDDRTSHRMISHYAMMSFVSTSSNQQLCLKPYYISKPSAELFGSSGGSVTSQQSTRGLVVKRLSPTYHPAIQYIVTQVPGPSIRDIVRSSGRPLSPETSLLLVANLFKAMKQLHSLQIVHGNIHWGNVGLSEDGKDLIFFDFSYAHFGDSHSPAPLQQKYLAISQLQDLASSSIPSHFRDDVLRGYEIFFFMVFGDTYSRELDAAAAAASSLSNLKKLKNEYFEARSVFKSRNLPDWATTGGIKDGLNAIRDELAKMIESCSAETTTTTTKKSSSCDPQYYTSKILENISKIFKTHKFGKYLVSDRLTLLEKILIFENERVGNLLLRDRPVTRIMSASTSEDTGLSNQSLVPYPRKSSRQIEAVFRGTWKRESRCFAKFITTFIGSRDVKEGQQTLLAQAKMYLLVKASEKFVDDKSISQYITGLATSYDIHSPLPYYIVRQSWPPSQQPTGLSVTGLIVTRESGAISVEDFINLPTTLSSASDQPLFIEKIAAKICIALIRAIQQLHEETKIVYNNFYLEKVFTATAPTTPLSEYSPKIYLYDLSRAVHDEIAPWKPTYKTPREIYSASPFEMEKNDNDQFVTGISFDSDIYQAVEFFFKILFKSETRFTAAVSECLSMNPKRVSKRRANIDRRDFKYFEELSRKLDYGSSSRVTSILDDLEEVVLSQDANLDKYAKAIEKFEEIINLSG